MTSHQQNKKVIDEVYFTFKPRKTTFPFFKVFIFLVMVFFIFNANASYCLSEETNGNLRIDSVSVESCPSGLILLSKSEYDAINQDGVIATLTDLFEFSGEDFAYFNAICLIGFIAGHSIGRVLRVLGKT